MDEDTMEQPGITVTLDIRDRPILERGVPAEGEDMDPWLGAMLRTMVNLVSASEAPVGWEQIRDGLDMVTLYLREELLPCAGGAMELAEVSEDQAQRYLNMACPPAGAQQRRAWARVMGQTVFGLMITYWPMPADDPEFDRWWADMMRGLWALVVYVRTENGPLTWTTA